MDKPDRVLVCSGHDDSAWTMSVAIRDMCKLIQERFTREELNQWYDVTYPHLANADNQFAEMIQDMGNAIDEDRVMFVLHHIKKTEDLVNLN